MTSISESLKSRKESLINLLARLDKTIVSLNGTIFHCQERLKLIEERRDKVQLELDSGDKEIGEVSSITVNAA